MSSLAVEGTVDQHAGGRAGAAAATTPAPPTPEAPGGDDDVLPCPACGTAAPLVDGACSDCGLVLA